MACRKHSALSSVLSQIVRNRYFIKDLLYLRFKKSPGPNHVNLPHGQCHHQDGCNSGCHQKAQGQGPKMLSPMPSHTETNPDIIYMALKSLQLPLQENETGVCCRAGVGRLVVQKGETQEDRDMKQGEQRVTAKALPPPHTGPGPTQVSTLSSQCPKNGSNDFCLPSLLLFFQGRCE